MALSDLIASRTPAPLEELSVPVGPFEAIIPTTIADEGSSSGEVAPNEEATESSDNGNLISHASPLDSQIPRGVAESVTPSGIEWAIGLFEGEGSFTTSGRGYLSMVIQMTDEDIVQRFHEIVGVGTIRGPYGPYEANVKPTWRWVARGQAAHELAERFREHLGERRQGRLEELLGQVIVPKAVSDSQASMAKTPGEGGRLTGTTVQDPDPGPSESQVPRGVAETVTPSGISIYFQAGPKRLYKLNGKEVPSMSDVLSILDKPALVWWGMKVGIQGMLETADGWNLDSSVEEVVALLTERKLTVNHVRDKAGDRGTNVHDAFEVWATKGIMPQPEIYGEEERGYVEALLDFINYSGVEPRASEVMVGSTKLKFAGRFDLRGWIPDGANVVVKTYPKKKPLMGSLQGGDWLLDVKTSKGVYDTHFLQLEGYEGASIESGYEPTVARGVIHLLPYGRYELVRSKATYADFKKIKGAYDALTRLKAR